MRQAAGTSIKSSLSHAFTYDTRDDKLAATRGAYGKIYQELAGLALGGDAHFYKVEAEGQVSRKLWERSGVVSWIFLYVLVQFEQVQIVSFVGC